VGTTGGLIKCCTCNKELKLQSGYSWPGNLFPFYFKRRWKTILRGDKTEKLIWKFRNKNLCSWFLFRKRGLNVKGTLGILQFIILQWYFKF